MDVAAAATDEGVARFPDVGPAALSHDGALHLGWPKLPPWAEPVGPSVR